MCITSDKHNVAVDIVLHYIIEDPVKCVYEVENMHIALQKHIETALFKCVHGIDVMRLMNDRDVLDKDTTAALNGISNKWGVKVLSVEIQGVTPPKEITSLLEQLAVRHQKDVTSIATETNRLEFEKRRISVQKDIDEATHLAKMQNIEYESREELAKAKIKASKVESEATSKRKFLEILLGEHASDERSKYVFEEMRLGEMGKLANGENKTVLLPHDLKLIQSL